MMYTIDILTCSFSLLDSKGGEKVSDKDVYMRAAETLASADALVIAAGAGTLPSSRVFSFVLTVVV